MSISPRPVADALEFARAEHDNPTQDWTNYCQRFVRTAYGIPALYESAWAQWVGADDADRHEAAGHENDPGQAPLGSALCFKGSGPYGHIMIAARDNGAWSNDLIRPGCIDWVRRTAPTIQWGQRYLGYLTAVNDFDLQLHTPRPPRPKQDKRYKAVARAIERMENAIANAIRLGDKADARALRTELAHLRDLYELLRHS